jgi:GNAT superfamily N-acetyltransferase
LSQDGLRVVEYDPGRRAAVAGLMGAVWGERPSEAELEWFYEQNPVRPASVLIAEADGKTVATAAISFVRMSIGDRSVEVGMPLRVATDPDYRGRGIFGRLEAENEERVRDLGVPLLLTVPNASSAPVFLNRLGWKPLRSLRVWARLAARRRAPRSEEVERFTPGRPAHPGGRDLVLRDSDWLNWRFADSPTAYHLIEQEGYAVAGSRGRYGVVAAVEGELLAAAAAASGARLVIAAPPPWQYQRYIFGGYVPTHRTFTVLGKALDPAQAVPDRPHFELGDLDFL